MEDESTRIVWITLLALMDKDSFVEVASIPNLAHQARVSNEACERAVGILEAPDANSSDPDFEGRRIERVPGGWLVLNAEKYREIGSLEHKRAKGRERVARWKEKQKKGNAQSVKGNAELTHGYAMQIQIQKKNKSVGVQPSIESDGPDRIAKPIRRARAQIPDSDFLNDLKTKSAYSAINVTLELEKAETWCAANHRTCTRRFFVNWLNRVEKPLAIPKPQSRVGAQAKPVAVESDRADSAEIISTWNDLADAMGEPLEKLVKKSVALGQLSKDDARMILGELNAQ